MAQGSSCLGTVEGVEDPSLATPNATQASPIMTISSDNILASSAFQRAIDNAMSLSLPNIVKVAVQAATAPARKPPRKRHRARATSPSSLSSLSEDSPESSPHKRKRKTKHLDSHSHPHKGRRRRAHKARQFSDSSSSYSPSHSSSSGREEGELSGEEPEDPKVKKDRLFPSDYLAAMVDRSSSCLYLRQPGDLDSESDQDRSEAFPKRSAKGTVFPFPKAFNSVFAQDWCFHPKGLGSSMIDKYYTLPEKQMALLQVPKVDAPVAALASSTVPVDGDVWPKDSTDRRMESSLKRAFEQCSFAFRASSANSVMSRAAFIWAQEAAKIKKLPKSIKNIFKKIALASAFAADASWDSMRLSARAMASTVSTRRALWLRSWSGEGSSHSKLINLPFEGNFLFGKALDPILVKGKDKRKVLPSGKKESTKGGHPSFRSFRSRYKESPRQQFKSRWTNARVLPRGKPSYNKRRDARRSGNKDTGTA